MRIIATDIPDVLILEPTIIKDGRGFFYESFNHQAFNEATGSSIQFVQDNHSHSKKGVLRGLHYQIQQPQGKLMRVVRGTVFDVAVDIRKSSKHFGKWIGIELSEDNHKQLWIPPGFAHGFAVLSDSADFLYKVTDYYAPEHACSILWNDPVIGIDWPIEIEPLLSVKDSQANLLANAQVFD